MIILTSKTLGKYPDYHFKAQIHSDIADGLKLLYEDICADSDLCAAKTVVRKNFGNAAAESVRRVEHDDEIKQLAGDYFTEPESKQVFQVWIFNPKAA